MNKIAVIVKDLNQYSGACIQIFDALLTSAGLSREDIQFVDLTQTRDLFKALVDLNPPVIVPLGSDSLEILTGHNEDLMKQAGKPFNFEKGSTVFTIIPSVSLAYLVRDTNYMVRAQRHWEDIGRIAKGGSWARPKKSVKHVFVQDIKKARKLFARMRACKEIAFDLETTGLNFLEDRILCYSFSWQPFTAVVLPLLGHKEAEIWTAAEKEEIIHSLKDLFANPDIEWIAHNISFDEKFLMQQDIHIAGPIHDTMLLSALIDENAKDLKGLKPLAELYTDLGDYDAELEEYVKDSKVAKAQELHARKKKIRAEIKKINKIITKTDNFSADIKELKNRLIGLESDLEDLNEVKIDVSYAEIPANTLWEYAATDADATFRIFQLFYHRKLRHISDTLVKPYGKSMVKLYRKLIMPLRKVLNGMEFQGAQLDLKYLKQLDKDYTEQTDKTEAELFEMPEIKKVEQKLWEDAAVKIGERYDKLKKPPKGISRDDYIQKHTKPIRFNMNSANHLRILIYGVLGVRPFKQTPAGMPSTDKEVLEKLAEDEIHPAIVKFQENRKLQKLHKTYVKGMQKRADINGRVHTNFNQHIARTGRLSSSAPNLQNIPRANKDIKKAFITQPGWSIIQADLAQAEFRMWAQLSQDQDMINDIASGMDIHAVTAREFWNIPEDEEVPKELRSAAKFVVFGLMYGRGAESVAKQVKIKKEEAEAIIENFFGKYPVAARWLQVTRKFASSYGYVWNHFGRVRRLPHASSPDKEKAAEASRQAVNAPIQGSAADITGIGLIRIKKELDTRKLKARLILTVHDSIILECPDNELLEVVQLCHECMTAHVEGLNVPIVAEVEVGKTWADVEEWPTNRFKECYEKYCTYGTIKNTGIARETAQ